VHYTALFEREGKWTTVQFPDCPGCATFAEDHEDAVAMGKEALEGWLEAHLMEGDVAPQPAFAGPVPRGAKAVPIEVAPTIAARLQIRWAREALGISQAELARRMGVPRQQVSRIESSDANMTMATIDRVAHALGVGWSIQIGG
jgi:antitoxin HicB